MTLVKPVIVVPGITGTTLHDEYPLDADNVWSITSKEYDKVTLHPDNRRYEMLEPARVVSGSLFDIPYNEFIKDLRHDLTQDEDEPVPVFQFPYDWRQPLELTQERLAQFIDEVIERTKLLRHYHKDRYGDKPKVNLVGHSMGGLIIAGYIATKGSKKVHKVASLGAPFQGTPEAVRKITTGTSSQRERSAARLTPALYYLLPKYEGAVCAAPGLCHDLFNVKSWQPSIIDTLATFISKHGLSPSKSYETQACELLQAMLDEAREYRRRLEELSFSNDSDFSSRDWLCIVGIGENTPVTLHIEREDEQPQFNFDDSIWREEWRQNNNSTDTGDGSVPYLGARCDFIPTEQVVCVTQDDFKFSEFTDRLLESLRGLHSILPEMNLVQRLVVSHFRGTRYRDVWGRCAPGLDPEYWNPPISGLDPK